MELLPLRRGNVRQTRTRVGLQLSLDGPTVEL